MKLLKCWPEFLGIALFTGTLYAFTLAIVPQPAQHLTLPEPLKHELKLRSAGDCVCEPADYGHRCTSLGTGKVYMMTNELILEDKK